MSSSTGTHAEVCLWVPSARSHSPFPLAKAALSAFQEALELALLVTAVSQLLSFPLLCPVPMNVPPPSLPLSLCHLSLCLSNLPKRCWEWELLAFFPSLQQATASTFPSSSPVG